jgi:hypothetical protein
VVARAGFAARLPAEASVASALVDYAQGNPLSVVRAGAPGQAGIGRRVDVRKTLTDVTPPDAAAAALLQSRLGWEPARVITFGVTVSHEGSARPIEVLEALVGPAFAEKAEIARLVLQGVGGDGVYIDALDTATLRTVPPRNRPAGAAEPASAGA